MILGIPWVVRNNVQFFFLFKNKHVAIIFIISHVYTP